MLSCKVNGQVGGHAPKSIGYQPATAINWVAMLRNGVPSGPFLGPAPPGGWSCSEIKMTNHSESAIFMVFLPLFGWLCSEIIDGFSTVILGGHAPNFAPAAERL